MTTRRVVSVKIVLFAIGCNCILLASTDPKWQPEEIPLWMLVCEFFFSALFLVECTIKVVAYGFCEYLSDSWNCLDFLVVLESLVSIIFEYGGLDFDLNLSILRVLRVLRPLRSVNKFPMLKNIINASLSSMALLKTAQCFLRTCCRRHHCDDPMVGLAAVPLHQWIRMASSITRRRPAASVPIRRRAAVRRQRGWRTWTDSTRG